MRGDVAFAGFRRGACAWLSFVLPTAVLLAGCGPGETSAPAPEAAPAAAAALTSDYISRPLPNPTSEVILNWAKMPAGREWGTTAGIDIDPHDGHIWAYDRCGAGLRQACENAPELDPVFKFDRHTGEVLTSFGAGLFVTPHGFHVDSDGNVWVTDFDGNEAGTKGHQVIKFSPEGEVLMRLGEAGVPGSGPGQLNQPCDVITAPNGDIFVSDGHSGQHDDPPEGSTGRIVKFDKDGNFIKQWGEIGFRPGQFRTPHGLAFDSQGRLFVADRGNHRIQIFDQEGNLLDIYYQHGRISGLFIAPDDTLYAIDSESDNIRNPGWLNGVRIGPAGEDRITAFIPPHAHHTRPGQGAAGEGVVVDADGNVYAAEGPNSREAAQGGITKYVAASQ